MENQAKLMEMATRMAGKDKISEQQVNLNQSQDISKIIDYKYYY